MKECIQVNDEIGRKCGGAGGMKDAEACVIVHDQGILFQWFRAVGAAFGETLNPCCDSVFVGHDEHDLLPL